MKKGLAKIVSAILLFAMLAALLSAAAFAEVGVEAAGGITPSDAEVSEAADSVTDSDAEASETVCQDILPEPKSAQAYSSAVVPDKKELSCNSFISNAEHRNYINRMMTWYLTYAPSLTSTLKSGKPVIMLFEGGSDNTGAGRGTDVRNAAVCIVLRYDSSTGKPYVAYACEDCSTLPDYPLAYSYPNGHSHYGSAAALDGVYSIYTVNHKSIYAGFNVRVGSSANVPAMYMRDDGTISCLNAVGINVHTRVDEYVSGDTNAPHSAGCLVISNGPDFADYMKFLSKAVPEPNDLVSAEFNGSKILKYKSTEDMYAGMLVIDRYLYKDKIAEIYSGNYEAAEYLTAYSTAAQADKTDCMTKCTVYPSYLSIRTTKQVNGLTLPDASKGQTAEAIASDTALTAIGLYQNASGEYWYKLLTGSGVCYIPCSSAIVKKTLYDDLCIHNEKSPVVKKTGKSFSISGILASAYNLYTSVNGAVSKADGTVMCTSSYSGKVHTYDVSWPSPVDNNLSFGKLAEGEYIYTLSAHAINWYVEHKNGEPVLKSVDKTVTLVNAPFIVTDADPFEDIKETDYFYLPVMWAATAKPQITNGVDKTHFAPDRTYTRAQAVTFLWRANGCPSVSGVKNPFTDVPSGAWYTEAVLWAAKNGITNGTSETTFSPNARVTRAQAVTFLYRAAKGEPAQTANPFADVDSGAWYAEAVLWAVKNGITNGTGAASFAPDDACTRGQFITLLYRYMH